MLCTQRGSHYLNYRPTLWAWFYLHFFCFFCLFLTCRKFHRESHNLMFDVSFRDVTRNFCCFETMNGILRLRLELKLGIVLISRSRQVMKRDLYHWILHKILKKKRFIKFFGQLTFWDHAKFLRVLYLLM